MNVYYNPLDTACKSITGGIYTGQTLQLNIYNLEDLNENEEDVVTKFNLDKCTSSDLEAYVLICRDGETQASYLMTHTEYGWTYDLTIEESGLYFYKFKIGEIYIEQDSNYKGEIHQEQITAFQLTVSSSNYVTPNWIKGGVMYQIFPDRFNKKGDSPIIEGRINRIDWGGTPYYLPNDQGKILNNDFFGGNFKGIEEKLPYLKNLGINIIYLNPIFEAASNHRYDTSDYMNVDPMLGTNEDFKDLVDKAKEYGIKIILDGVFNHTGDNSIYFNKYGKYPSVGAYQSKESPYYSWYNFQEFPNKYSSWWGIDILPEINETSEEYQNFIFGEDGVLKKWLNVGIGGYRLDVADELPDFFLKNLRKSVKSSNEDAVIIGEVWEDASNKISYSQRRSYFQGEELDSVMNYPLKDAIINYILTEKALTLANTMRMLVDHYPKQSLDCLMNILGTHDTPRILTILSQKICYSKDEMASYKSKLTEYEKETGIKKVKMAAFIQYTMPGIPCIYYGDENAMEGHIDPFCRRCFNWDELNEDLINYYAKLGNIRNKLKNVFKTGDYKELFVENGCIFYKREGKDQSAYIFVNNSDKKYFLELKDGEYRELLEDKVYKDVISVDKYSYGIIVKEN